MRDCVECFTYVKIDRVHLLPVFMGSVQKFTVEQKLVKSRMISNETKLRVRDKWFNNEVINLLKYQSLKYLRQATKKRYWTIVSN